MVQRKFRCLCMEIIVRQSVLGITLLLIVSSTVAAWAETDRAGGTNAADGAVFSKEEWIVMESARVSDKTRDVFVWSERAPASEKHRCVFYLKGRNQANLEEIVLQVSDPRSPLYGKHLTKKEIDELTVDKAGTEAVLKFIESTGATVVDKNASAITAEAPVSVWESAFHTAFFIVKDTEAPNDRLLRAHEYSLPSSIAKYVQFVGGSVQMPVRLHHGQVIMKPLPPGQER